MADLLENIFSESGISGNIDLTLNPDDVDTYVKELEKMDGVSEGTVESAKNLAAEFKTFGAMTASCTSSVKDLASSEENVTLQAQLAKEKYNALDAELASTRNEIKEMSNESEANADKLAKLTSKEEALARSQKQAKQTLDAYNAAVEYREIEAQVSKLEGSLSGVSSEMAQMQVPSATAKSVTDIMDTVNKLDEELEVAKQRAATLRDAFNLDTSNVEYAREYTEALGEVEEIASKKADALSEAMSKYKDAGIADAEADTEKLRSSTEEATAKWVEANSELQKASGKIAILESKSQELAATGAPTEDYRKLGDEIDDCKSELKQLESNAKDAEDALDTAKACQEYQELQDELLSTQKELKKTTAEEESVSSGMNSASLHSLGDGIRDVGQAFSQISGYAQNFIEEIFEVTDEVDSAYRDMRKTVDATESQYEDLYDSAVEFSNTSVVSTDQMLEIEALGGQLGIAAEDLDTFAETVANISIATDLDSDEAAEDLGQLANIIEDLDASTMPNFSDALVRLGNNTAATESDIIDVSTRIGSMGSIVGLSSSEILAWSASLVETGMTAESAGTAFSNTMSAIETAVSEGGEDLEGFASIAGMSADEFASTWEDEPTEALQAFIEGLAGIEENEGSADAALENLGITGTKQKQAIEGLMQTIDGLDDNLEMSEDAWNGVSDEWGSAGDAANEAEQKSEGFSGALQRVQNAGENIVAVFGESLAPFLNDVADNIGDLATAAERMTDAEAQNAVKILAVVAAIGPLAVGLGNVIEGYANLKKALAELDSPAKKFKTSLAETGSVSKTVTSGLGSLGKKVVKVVGPALAALVAIEVASALSSWDSSAKKASKSVSEIADSAKDLADASDDTAESIDGNIEFTTEGIYSITEWIGDRIQDISGFLNNLSGNFENTFLEVGDSASILSGLSGIFGAASDGLDTLGSNISNWSVDTSAAQQVNDIFADFNDTIEDTMVSVYSEEASVERDLEIVDRYLNQTGLTTTQQQLFTEAVDELNEALETNYTVSDAANGQLENSDGNLVKNTDHLKELVDEYKQAAEVAAYTDLLTEAYEDLYEAKESGDEAAIDKYNEKIAELEGQIGIVSSDLSDELSELANSVEPAMQTAAADVLSTFSTALENGEIDQSVMDKVEQAIEDEDWETVWKLCDKYGYACTSTIADGMADASYEIDEATAGYMSDIITGLEDGDVELAQTALGIGDDVTSSLAKAIEDGSIDAQVASDALAQACYSDDWSGIIEMYASNGVALPQSLSDGISDGSIALDDATAQTLAKLAIDPETSEAAASVISAWTGMGTDTVNSLISSINEYDFESTDVEAALEQIMTEDDWSALCSLFYTNGLELPQWLVDGINNGEFTVNGFVTTVEGAMRTELATSLEETGVVTDATVPIDIEGATIDMSAVDVSALNMAAITLNDPDATEEAKANAQTVIDGYFEGQEEALAAWEEAGYPLVDYNSRQESAFITAVDSGSPSEVWKGHGDDIVQGLANGINGGTEEGGVVAQAFSTLLSTVTGAWSELEGTFSEEGSSSAKAYTAGMMNNTDGVISTANLVGTTATDTLSSSSSTFGTIGSNSSYSYATSLDDYEDTAGSNASSLESTVESNIDGTAKAAKSEATSASSAFANGIASKLSSVLKYAVKMANNAAKMNRDSGKTYTWGYDLGNNFATGLSAQSVINSVKSGAQTLANAVSNILQFTVPKEGPWSGAEKGGERSGMHLVENFATGMRAAIPEIEAASMDVASAIDVEGRVGDVEASTAAAVEAAASNVSANVLLTQTREDRTDELIDAINSIDITCDEGTTVNYYIGDTKVQTGSTDEQFAAQFIKLMEDYGRLAKL